MYLTYIRISFDEDMYRQRFYEVAGKGHSTLNDRYLPEMWEHIADIQQFLPENNESMYSLYV